MKKTVKTIEITWEERTTVSSEHHVRSEVLIGSADCISMNDVESSVDEIAVSEALNGESSETAI